MVHKIYEFPNWFDEEESSLGNSCGVKSVNFKLNLNVPNEFNQLCNTNIGEH